MRKSGYRTILHIYLIFFISLLGTILMAFTIFLMLITVQKPNGEAARSDWAKLFTERLREQIVVIDGTPQLKQSGMEQLQDNRVGFQILDDAGTEVYAFQKPNSASVSYSNTDLLHLYQTGNLDTQEYTSFVGEVTCQENDYVYLVHFPMEIRKVTMYINAERFTGGKTVILQAIGIFFLVVIAAGILYGFWTAKLISRLTASIHDIAKRCYLPLQKQGAFGDLSEELNALDREIKASDMLRLC